MTGERMDAIETTEFLEAQYTGVLAMGRDNIGYGIPISYTYDTAGPYIYFRLAYAGSSQKRKFIEAADSVAFVVYAETEGGWKSVVAEGAIEERSETDFEARRIEAVRRLDIPYFTVHDRPADDLEFVIARIDVSNLTGVVEGGSDR
ncbi:MAG: pyridoxamine 5'-phosphate oxidase family protein [Halolamina sp.]|uniref:pyridoxamine 5'-phosphate oxidase family protein n=1 Tax=Halolamina sp. TaxID=1940283 RepID=UPI002FC347C0